MDRREQTAREFLDSLPYARALGMTLVHIAPAEAGLTMPHDPRLIGDPLSGAIHGGAIAALMDTCAGLAVVSHPLCAGSTATLDLRIDRMRGSRPGRAIRARAQCHRVTRSVAFVRAEAFDGDDEAEGAEPIASATGAFTFNRAEG
ncbi:PaaI family thioesterase [Palleronia sediminis]|uniref:PaaI family thioesterase n=1 Tax=Palleronia sediminis TaxID=2547833 RepID=A0A4R5ZVM4_9RHOB|nr:PaaI family thioesterase [Palleronia sediminis]TDL74225.1 PaaI family thioesterase [Palleronia sediminis]